MKNKFYSKFFYRVSIILVVVSMFPLFFISRNLFIAFTQIINRNDKTLIKETFKNEPIEIINLKSSGKSFHLDERAAQGNSPIKNFILQDSDWFKDFTIDFRNISDKPIIYVNIAITFPETRSTGHSMAYFLKYGVNLRAPNTNNDEIKLLAPNEIGQIILSPKRYGILRSFLASRNHSLTDLTQAVLTIQTVAFADGTYWSGGGFYRPDPNRPDRSILVNENQ